MKEIQNELGAEIRRLRIAKEWSQEQLGAAVKIHRNSVARYEAGGDIPMMLFYEMCVALGERADDVLKRVLPDA